MKTITISDEVLDSLDKLGVEYEEGDTIYEKRKRHDHGIIQLILASAGRILVLHYMAWMGWLGCSI